MLLFTQTNFNQNDIKTSEEVIEKKLQKINLHKTFSINKKKPEKINNFKKLNDDIDDHAELSIMIFTSVRNKMLFFLALSFLTDFLLFKIYKKIGIFILLLIFTFMVCKEYNEYSQAFLGIIPIFVSFIFSFFYSLISSRSFLPKILGVLLYILNFFIFNFLASQIVRLREVALMLLIFGFLGMILNIYLIIFNKNINHLGLLIF
jgi:hypothetical protein